MRTLTCCIVALVTIAAPAPIAAQAGIGQATTVLSAPDVPTAVRELTQQLESRGLEIVLTLDHAANAQSVGLTLRPTQVLFARPGRLLERVLLFRPGTLGLDLPLKFLVFEDENGAIRLTYNTTGYFEDRHGIGSRGIAANALDRLTRGLGENHTGVVTVASRRTLNDTVASLRSAITGTGAFRIPLVLDYGSRFRAGPVLIVFGNPRAGTPLMQANQLIGLDLPQKFLVWKDRRGRVMISYNDPFFIAQRNNVQGEDQRLAMIATALANFAAAGAGSP